MVSPFIAKIPKYQIVLIVAGVFLIGMTLYPPWRISLHTANRNMSQVYGWAWLFDPPAAPDEWMKEEPATLEMQIMEALERKEGNYHENPRKTPWASRYFAVNIDFGLLTLEWLVIIILGGITAVPLFLADRKSHSSPIAGNEKK
jgi:hypothetical protein